jgi:hypothetical protein
MQNYTIVVASNNNYSVVMFNTSENRAKFRRANRVLSMVLYLHKWGYQKIRIAPGISDDGKEWECAITHIRNIDHNNGALLSTDPHDGHVAHYTTAESSEYFGWTDAQRDNSRELAERFMQRFPKLLGLGNGRDWAYSGWYVSVLGIAETGHLPVAYGDPNVDLEKGVIGTISLTGKDLYLQSPPLI